MYYQSRYSQAYSRPRLASRTVSFLNHAYQSFGRLAPRQLLPEKLVMAAQTEPIRLVQDYTPEQLQKVFREFGLLIQWVQLTMNRSSGIIWIPRHPLPVKRLLLPPVGDAGEYFAGLALGNHLKKDAPAIAIEVIAVEFEISVFVSGQMCLRGGVRCGTKMHAAHLALGQFGKQRMKWYHGESGSVTEELLEQCFGLLAALLGQPDGFVLVLGIGD
jgi:hypothetical protein